MGLGDDFEKRQVRKEIFLIFLCDFPAVFSQEAVEVSIRPGAVPIIMIDGKRMVELMIQNGIGIQKRPLYLFEIDEEFFRIE